MCVANAELSLLYSDVRSCFPAKKNEAAGESSFSRGKDFGKDSLTLSLPLSLSLALSHYVCAFRSFIACGRAACIGEAGQGCVVNTCLNMYKADEKYRTGVAKARALHLLGCGIEEDHARGNIV